MIHDVKPAVQEDAAAANAPAAAPLDIRRISSAELFAGAREIEIEHNGRRYRLRITQTSKLILTA